MAVTEPVRDADYERENRGFRAELQTLINSHSRENGSDTPDWVLAEYLVACLEAFDRAVNMRNAWHDAGNFPRFEPGGIPAGGPDDDQRTQSDGSGYNERGGSVGA